MKDSPNRVARLTSSKIYPLTVSGKGLYGFGAGAITYIKERIAEFELGRGVEPVIFKREMLWGKLWEPYVNMILGFEYEMIVDKTTVHPNYPFWSGSQDFNINIEGKGIAELKCYQLKNFHEYSRCLMQKNIDILKKNFSKEYWQIVSNSCINGTKYGEAIAFMPTEEMLLEMREKLENTDYIVKELKDDEFKYKFVWESDLLDLPFIPKHSDFTNMTKFRFEVPQSDKDFLTERVEKAILLIENDEVLFS